MKKVLLFCALFASMSVAVQAQSIKWGVRGGVSTPDINPNDIGSVKIDSVRLAVQNANYGFHVGGWARFGLSKLFIQPEVLFNSSKVTYKVTKENGQAVADSLRNETFRNLDIPLLVGFRLAGIRFMGGPVGHLSLGSYSDLIKNYQETFKKMKYGYQVGLGLDFSNIGIDLRYEGNFDKFGSHINVGGQQYEFSKAPARMLATVSIAF